jgi:hypothetical protein
MQVHGRIALLHPEAPFMGLGEPLARIARPPPPPAAGSAAALVPLPVTTQAAKLQQPSKEDLKTITAMYERALDSGVSAQPVTGRTCVFLRMFHA